MDVEVSPPLTSSAASTRRFSMGSNWGGICLAISWPEMANGRNIGIPGYKMHRFSMDIYIWVFPKLVVPQNGWFIIENLAKMDDLGVPLVLETPIYHLQMLQFPLPAMSGFHFLGGWVG